MSTPNKLRANGRGRGRAGRAGRAGSGGPRPTQRGARARPQARRPGPAHPRPRGRPLRRRAPRGGQADGPAHARRDGHRPRRAAGRRVAPRAGLPRRAREPAQRAHQPRDRVVRRGDRDDRGGLPEPPRGARRRRAPGARPREGPRRARRGHRRGGVRAGGPRDPARARPPRRRPHPRPHDEGPAQGRDARAAGDAAGLIYLGTSAFAAEVLKLLAETHPPELVVTRPDAPRGRGRRLAAPPVADTARELGIDVVQPEDVNAFELPPGDVVLCAYGALVREPLLGRGVLNLHPSLLPRWRGAAPVERAIMAGDAETGVSIMRLTEGLDSGPVCLCAAEPIRPHDDYGTLAARLQELGGELLVRALDERPPWIEQDEAGVTYAHKIEPADRVLDPTRTPADLERTVRALRPHIGARLPLPGGGFLGVIAAAPAGPARAPAGRVRTEGDRLLLECNGGALELTEIQPPGRRPMPAQAWLRGRPDPALTDFWVDPQRAEAGPPG